MPGKLALEPVRRAERGAALGAVAGSPWAPVVAMAGAHQVVVCTTEPLDFAGVLAFPEGQICDLKFSRNGKLLVAGGGEGGKSGLVVAWDITTGERVITIEETAELDLRGATALDDKTVMELLIARLAALQRRTARSR